MRVAAFLVFSVLRVGLVSAAPGVVVVPRVAVYLAPSEAATVDYQLVSGDPICVVDKQDDASGEHPGWLAIRRPGGIGFVRTEAVDLAVASPAAAQHCDAAPTAKALAGTFVPRHPVRILLGLGSGAAWLRETAAARHHIGNVGPTFHAVLGVTIYDLVTISGLGGAAFPSDDASFREDVMPLGGGDPSTQTSQLEVQSYSIAAGLRTPFLILRTTPTRVYAGALFADAGSSYVHGIRRIERCVNCRKEDLELASGGFWRVGVDLTSSMNPPIPLSWGLSVAYQRYGADSGLTQGLSIDLTFWIL
jgi:hypothetical protein